MAQAFRSTRAATPQGLRAVTLVVEQGRIVEERDWLDTHRTLNFKILVISFFYLVWSILTFTSMNRAEQSGRVSGPRPRRQPLGE
jgi:hypothetical protein